MLASVIGEFGFHAYNFIVTLLSKHVARWFNQHFNIGLDMLGSNQIIIWSCIRGTLADSEVLMAVVMKAWGFWDITRYWLA
jgi:hypothetical protein